MCRCFLLVSMRPILSELVVATSMSAYACMDTHSCQRHPCRLYMDVHTNVTDAHWMFKAQQDVTIYRGGVTWACRTSQTHWGSTLAPEQAHKPLCET